MSETENLKYFPSKPDWDGTTKTKEVIDDILDSEVSEEDVEEIVYDHGAKVDINENTNYLSTKQIYGENRRTRKTANLMRKVRESMQKGLTAREIVDKYEKLDDVKHLKRLFKHGLDKKIWTKENIDVVLRSEFIVNGTIEEFYKMRPELWQRLPIMVKFKEGKKMKYRLGSYLRHIQRFCEFHGIYPHVIIEHEKPLEFFSELYTKFKNAQPDASENYLASLRSFLGYNGVMVPTGYRGGDLQVKQSMRYADVELTDKQFEECLYWLDEHYPDFLKYFAIQHEIFARSNALLRWKVNFERKQMEIDGELCEYLEIPRFFEPKTRDYWTKRVFDHRVIHILENLPQNQYLFPINMKAFKTKHLKLYYQALREMYMAIGILPKGTKVLSDLEQGSKQAYIWKEPAYALRHSGARMWNRRANYNPQMVATMGWNEVGILTKHYAGTTDSEFFSQKTCEVCSPRNHKFDNMEFCSTSHALLHYQREKNAS